MPPASAAARIEDYWEDEGDEMSAPPSEQAQYEPRFRVVPRKPQAGARKRTGIGPVQRAIVLTLVPVLFLVGYVLFSTLNMRGAYQRAQLKAELKQIMIERQELEAEIRRQQAPGRILHKAKELGMEPAREREFARVPAPKDSDPVR